PRTYWHQVRVVGTLRPNADEDGCDTTFINLAEHTRELIGTQPRRNWVLGFTLFGATMRVFRFDRSGAIASTPIDIH
ncbi:hypothetical protein FN846DRAFT_783741, partial [Sphaerosporella brunnea]